MAIERMAGPHSLAAVQNNDESVADLLLATIDLKDLNCADTADFTCVQAAASNGNGAKLAAAGADCRVAGLSGWTAMRYVAHGGHFDIADALMAPGLSPSCPDIIGTIPAAIATRSGSLQFLSTLRELKVTFDELSPWTYTSLATRARAQ
ncbi:hypothetical protein MMC17_005056 [Xylographa soralifera]|nr:hypothetical protein [Xylographa soralifera]